MAPWDENAGGETRVLIPVEFQAQLAQRRRRHREVFGAGLLLLALGGCFLLQRRGIGQSEAVLQLVGLNAGTDHCEDFFNDVGNVLRDCSPKNYWECLDPDGSWAYTCCCTHGFGLFSNSSHATTGMINRAPKPDKCMDLGTPFELSGAPFSAGPAFVQQCDWGENNNKHFHLPTEGRGMIQWASHPKYCLGVKEGADFAGNEVHLQRCWAAPQSWVHFDIENRGQGEYTYRLLRWSAHPDKCMRAESSEDGARVLLSECQEQDPLQHFGVLPLLEKPARVDYPRLFCLSLMLPFGAEVELMRLQFEKQIGIFECADSAIYSNESFTFRRGNSSVSTDVMNGSMAVKFGGRWHSALNTDIFIRFYGKVLEDARAWRNHWTVKLDPDCVFFAWRLQEVLRSEWNNGDAGKPVFLNNCHLGMHGPIEVIGRHALGVYQAGAKVCLEGEPYTHKQEDYYFRECWKLLGIEQVDIYNLLLESAFACDERGSTRDGRHPCFSKQVSFHPFKTAKGYLECHKRGDSMRWSTPFKASSEVPEKWNHFHG